MLADVAGDNLDQFIDHVAETLGSVAILTEDRSTHYTFQRAAAHDGLACRDWWGTSAWSALVDRFLTALDDPHGQSAVGSGLPLTAGALGWFAAP